ncbi:hypothetical protein PHYSODRAFT_460130, partial [Phytophthora sojae]
VFKLQELSGHGTHLFNQPKLSTWVSYVTKLEGKDADEEMYKMLRASYGDDELATILLVGSKQHCTGKAAKRLEAVQQKVWLGERKTANAVFTPLKLNAQGDKIFESPAFSSWVDYMTKLSPEKAGELMLSTLKVNCKDEALVNMLMKAKKDASSCVIAGKLEAIQLDKWLKEDKSAHAVLKLL